MDQFSYRIGNLLVGNRADAAAVEVTLTGLIVEALAPAIVAVTGADLGVEISGTPVPPWTAIALAVGDRMTFARRVSGCRAYLAIRGGFDAPQFLGSRSTFTK